MVSAPIEKGDQRRVAVSDMPEFWIDSALPVHGEAYDKVWDSIARHNPATFIMVAVLQELKEP